MDDIQASIALQSISGLGIKSSDLLYQHFGSVKHILDAGYDALREAGLKPAVAEQIASKRCIQTPEVKQRLEKIQRWLESSAHHVLCIDQAGYPEQLKQIHCAPWVLYVVGDPALLSRPGLAMVGSRKPSIDGVKCAHAFSSALAQMELVIHSGLALGIDAAAHRGALDVVGKTVAVMATGADRIYPAQHARLADEIAETGALVSEMPLGTPPQAQNFPRRNRIISGLARGVLVVEAGVKSGSLITARYALEQNRDVFAMPGSILNPQARGPHALIKSGAKLVEDIQDILCEWVYPVPQIAVPQQDADVMACETATLSESEHKVLSRMGFDAVCFDELVMGCGLDVAALTELLVALELSGRVRQVPGGYQRVYQVESGLWPR